MVDLEDIFEYIAELEDEKEANEQEKKELQN